jgi:hypothetical protein
MKTARNLPPRRPRRRMEINLIDPSLPSESKCFGKIYVKFDGDKMPSNINLGDMGIFNIVQFTDDIVFAIKQADTADKDDKPMMLDVQKCALTNGVFFYNGEVVGPVKSFSVGYDITSITPYMFMPKNIRKKIIENYRNLDIGVTPEGNIRISAKKT